jgi:hypothetical protein
MLGCSKSSPPRTSSWTLSKHYCNRFITVRPLQPSPRTQPPYRWACSPLGHLPSPPRGL